MSQQRNVDDLNIVPEGQTATELVTLWCSSYLTDPERNRIQELMDHDRVILVTAAGRTKDETKTLVVDLEFKELEDGEVRTAAKRVVINGAGDIAEATDLSQDGVDIIRIATFFPTYGELCEAKSAGDGELVAA